MSSNTDIGSEATAVGTSPEDTDFGEEPTVAGGGPVASYDSSKTLDSSQEMSVDVTLPGESSQNLSTAALRTELARSTSMIGQVIGSYRLLEVLGEGGMGRVYLAEHCKIGRRVALKMLHTHLATSPDVVRRFFDEARAVNRILHEHIVEITDFIENEDGNNYFIMEYLRGSPLSDLVRTQAGNLSLARALGIGVQVASALSAVHAANIVHRDLKPENIFLTERGGQKDFVKLLDFGIAKLVGSHGDGLNLRRTEAGVIMGTPDYMSPQQASAQSVDHRTDIYSLGVILYEMCTGRLPFIAKDFGDLVVMHKTKRPTTPSALPDLMQEIPKPLDELILACLEKKPEDRPQSCKEVEEALRSIADEYAVELEHFDLSRRSSSRRKKGAPKLLLALGAAGAVAVAAFAFAGGSDSKEEAPAAASTPAVADAPAPPPAPRGVVVDDENVVFVSFESTPVGAMVFRKQGDKEEFLGMTPFTAAFDPAEHEATYVFKKEGFGAIERRASLAADGTLAVELEAEKPEPVATAEPDKVEKKRGSKRSGGKKSTKRSGDKSEKKSGKKGGKGKKMYKEGAVMDPFAQ